MNIPDQMAGSPIKRIGGKKSLRADVIKLLPADAKCYVEVFGGAAWVLLSKPRHAVEILNDIDGELMNLWRVFKWRPAELLERIDAALYSRELFFELRDSEPGHDEIERAMRMYLMIHLSYSGKMEAFGTWRTGARPGFLTTAPERFKSTFDRLGGVFVENLGFEAVLNKYDGATTIFYCDPPYYGQNHYGGTFGEEEHRALAATLSGIKGRFLLTINDCQFTEELYRDFHIRTGTEKRSAVGGHADREALRAPVLFVANYDLGLTGSALFS